MFDLVILHVIKFRFTSPNPSPYPVFLVTGYVNAATLAKLTEEYLYNIFISNILTI